MTPEEWAAKVVAELERRGVPPFEDCGWMNPEDRDVVRAPIADAIRAAVAAERERLAALIQAQLDYHNAEAADVGEAIGDRLQHAVRATAVAGLILRTREGA